MMCFKVNIMDNDRKRKLDGINYGELQEQYGGDVEKNEDYYKGREAGIRDGKKDARLGRQRYYSNLQLNDSYTVGYDDGYDTAVNKSNAETRNRPINNQRDMDVMSEEEPVNPSFSGFEDDSPSEDEEEYDEDSAPGEEEEEEEEDYEHLFNDEDEGEEELEEEAPQNTNPFGSELKEQYDEKRRLRQERWNKEFQKDIKVDESEEEDKDTEYSVDSISENINKDVKSISFKKEEQKRLKDLSKLPFSLYFFSSKLALFGIDKEQAEQLIKNIDIKLLEKFSAIFSMVEIDKLNLLHYEKVLSYLKSIDKLGFAKEVSNNLLLECLRGANIDLQSVYFTKIQDKIEFTRINCGIVDKKYVNKVNIKAIKEVIKKSKKQYTFTGKLLVTGDSISGFAIPMEKVYNARSGNALKIWLRLGTIYYIDGAREYLLLAFCAKDLKGNDYILIIK